MKNMLKGMCVCGCGKTRIQVLNALTDGYVRGVLPASLIGITIGLVITYFLK